MFCKAEEVFFPILNYDRNHVGVSYSGGGLPVASHLTVTVLSKGRAMIGPDV